MQEYVGSNPTEGKICLQINIIRIVLKTNIKLLKLIKN